tara:strand:+ start:1241 stop:2419 length:1179 start_codon:yes stop_codon:yes gene_type:complete
MRIFDFFGRMMNDQQAQPAVLKPIVVQKKSVSLSSDKLKSNAFQIKKSYGSDGYDKVTPWLIKHLIPAGSNGVWFGQSQSFKTFALIDIACRIATEKKFSDLPTKHGLVFIIAAEGQNGVSKRVRAWELQNNCVVGERLIVVPHAVFPTDKAQRLSLIDEMKSESNRQDLPVSLIIFDTMSQCSNGMSENEAGEVSKYLQSCKSIGEPVGATVINVHHTKKDSDDFRGSSTIVSNVDFLISMKRDKKYANSTKLNLTKMKEGSVNFQWDLELESCEIDAVDQEGESVNTLFLSDTIFTKLDGPVEKSGVKNPQYRTDASWLRGYLNECTDVQIPLSQIKQTMSAMLSVPVDDKLSMRLERAKKYLVDARVITILKLGREGYVQLIEPDSEIS